MATFPNFYETLAEANMRLRGTIVLYDGYPHYVLAIANHRDDGIFRIYLEPTGVGTGKMTSQVQSIPPLGHFLQDHSSLGPALDDWLGKNKTSILCKKMDSPLFKKFRPFPLGMCNVKGYAVYLERHPQRRTEQGLNTGALVVSNVSLTGALDSHRMDFFGPEFLACVRGDYPSYDECVTAMQDVSCSNTAVAFSRQFALVRGPVGTLFVAYQKDIVGFIPDVHSGVVVLGKKFRYLREAVAELNVFPSIVLQ